MPIVLPMSVTLTCSVVTNPHRRVPIDSPLVSRRHNCFNHSKTNPQCPCNLYFCSFFPSASMEMVAKFMSFRVHLPSFTLEYSLGLPFLNQNLRRRILVLISSTASAQTPLTFLQSHYIPPFGTFCSVHILSFIRLAGDIFLFCCRAVVKVQYRAIIGVASYSSEHSIFWSAVSIHQARSKALILTNALSYLCCTPSTPLIGPPPSRPPTARRMGSKGWRRGTLLSMIFAVPPAKREWGPCRQQAAMRPSPSPHLLRGLPTPPSASFNGTLRGATSSTPSRRS